MILNTTQSICPVCHRPLKAHYIAEDGRVCFMKTCPQHGTFQTTVAENAEDYQQWVKHPVINIAPKMALAAGDPQDQSCPLHCGTCENHLQTACCVLIDVTSRCNQHCPYCFAQSEKGVISTGQDENAVPAGLAENARWLGEPTLEEIEKKYDLLLELGEERPFNIQLSGGEPTLRDDLPQIIKMAREKGFSYVQINSNGRRLALEEGYAKVLVNAGASVIFMQFDGTRDDIYEALRGEPLFENKKKAIQNCEKAGLPVTLVPTLVKGVNVDNIGEIMDFALAHINVVKGIHFQPVSFFGRHPEVAARRSGPGTEGHDGIGGDTGDEGRATCAGSGGDENRTSGFGNREREGRAEGGGNEGDGNCDGIGRNGAGGGAGMENHEAGGSKAEYAGAVRTGDFPGRVTMFGLLRELEAQRSDFKYEHFCPIATGHTLCCFYSTYIREPDGSVRCTLSNAQKEAGISCCDALPSQGMGDAPGGGLRPHLQQADGAGRRSLPQIGRAEVIRRDRDFVLNKWEVASPDEAADLSQYKSSQEITALDDFLRYYRLNSFTVTGMAFQDVSNLDAERLKRCRVQVLSEDNKLIPFCAYNSIYRNE